MQIKESALDYRVQRYVFFFLFLDQGNETFLLAPFNNCFFLRVIIK